MRLWSILKFPGKLIGFYRLAKQSPFPTNKVWGILTGLTVKSAFEKNNDEVKHYRILGFTVYCYRYSTLLYLFREIFLRNQYHFNHEGHRPLIVDCGANIGMAILFFKKIYPGARIIAFEPNPFAFQLLEKNILINKLNDVEIHNEALSGHKGAITFFMNEDKGTLIGSIFKERSGNGSVDVKAGKLSDAIAGIYPDLIKMDVEGAEYEIIEELERSGSLTLAGQYIIEYHHQIKGQKPRLADFLKKFEAEDFNYNLITSFAEAGQFQDIIIYLKQPAGMKKEKSVPVNVDLNKSGSKNIPIV